MLKSELIHHIATALPYLTERDVELGIECILEKLSTSMENGDRIEIRDFGSFSVHHRPPRKAHNPRTRKHILTLGSYLPHFKPGKELRGRVNGNGEK